MDLGGKRKIGMHIAFSLGVLIILWVSRYEYLGMPKGQQGWTVILSYPFFLACIYIGRWFCGRWFNHHKAVSFLLYSLPCFLGLLVVWYFFNKICFSLSNLGLLEFSLAYGPFFIIGVAAGFLVKLFRAYQQKRVQDAQIKAAQKESELNLLQSQLSPHFLFNTLNNLYGVSIAEHQRIPALLLKLSDLLRYSVYDTKKTFVPLKDELDYISNYIAFEKMRISDRLIFTEAIEQVAIESRIAPMVLIVFVENAFKHAKDTLEQKIHITIHLKISGNFILFTISNTYRKEKEESGLLNENSGLGLANTIKRLDLLYGADYEMTTFVRDGLYHAHLKLKLM
jgi:hypothetical protein